MSRLFDWLDLGHYLSGAAHAAAGILCLGALYGAMFGHITAHRGMDSDIWRVTETGAAPIDERGFTLADIASARPQGTAAVTEVALNSRLNVAASNLEKERRCLATGIYFEARGETYYGQLAVAEVILNRVASVEYPDTVCEVVFQNAHRRNACQFSFACDGKADRPRDQLAWKKARRIAKYSMMGVPRQPVIGDATHYHADYVAPHWASAFTQIAKIGKHIFYRDESVSLRSSSS